MRRTFTDCTARPVTSRDVSALDVTWLRHDAARHRHPILRHKSTALWQYRRTTWTANEMSDWLTGTCQVHCHVTYLPGVSRDIPARCLAGMTCCTRWWTAERPMTLRWRHCWRVSTRVVQRVHYMTRGVRRTARWAPLTQ